MTSDNDTQRSSRLFNQTKMSDSPSGAGRKINSGDLIDNLYRLTSRLGQGGMGVVYACHHITLGKDYAIKLLHGDHVTEENWSRFQIEAKALARLKHPGIVTIYNMGIDQNQYPYYVMDLLTGENLEQWIKTRGNLHPDEALDCFMQVADALESAHRQNIIHRDIKPSNIMLLRSSKGAISSIKLVDFGIARINHDGQTSKAGNVVQSQTATGLIFGTPFYMSPEQSQGLHVDERSDIYSFGCALYEALTGSPPFRGENAFHTFMLHQNEPPPTLSSKLTSADAALITEALEQSLARMLAKSPHDRYQSMAQVKHDLERIKAGKEIRIKSHGTTRTATDGIEGTAESEQNKHFLARHQYLWLTAAVIVLAGATTLLFVINYRPQETTIKEVSDSTSPIQSVIIQQTQKTSQKSENNNIPGSAMPGLTEYQTLFPEALSTHIGSDEELLATGATPEEIQKLKTYDFLALKESEKIFHKEFATFLKTHSVKTYRFLRTSPTLKFQFPPNMILGYVQFGNDKPLAAIGDVPIPKGKRICFYLAHATRDYQDILDYFGPNDLNGLEMQLNNPTYIIGKLARWKKLDDLCFFNPLQKSLPKYIDYDESPLNESHLAALDKFPNLRSLGLCDQVSGPAILKMSILKRLDTLKLKSTINLPPLLQALPTYPNIKELWLVNCGLTDAQLARVAEMPNLQTLRIRRSKLTPASGRIFARMHKLKHLYLDRPWSTEEKTQFKQVVPQVSFETVFDQTYWQCLPADHPQLKM